MNYVKQLTNVLEDDLPWHKARLKFIARFTSALLKLTTVNLAKLALALNPNVKADSNYRRIQRFMADFAFNFETFGRLLLRLLPQESNLIVSMDRTNWQFGQQEINVLMIGICRDNTCFPIVWRLLGKAGNSNTDERIALMRRFLRLVDTENIRALVADREFIGHRWFAYLKAEGVPFYIRIRKNMKVGSNETPAWRLFKDLRVGPQWRIGAGKPNVLGHKLYVVGMRYRGREGEPEYLIVVTDSRPHWALTFYRKRWGIETLFGNLKSRGFDLEATHVTHSARIEKLIGILALAFAWSHLVGQWRHRHTPLQTKKHGRREKSLFRYGLDLLQQVMLNLAEKKEDFLTCLQALVAPRKFLSCT